MPEDDSTVGKPTRRRVLQSIAGAGLLAGGGVTGTVTAAPGEEQWRFEAGDIVASSPTVVDGTVYVGSRDANLYAVAADTGEQEWAFETGDIVDSSPTVGDGTVYVGSFDANLYAVAANTGEQEWAFETRGPVLSSPTVVDGTVYVGSDDGNLYAVAADTGEQEWAFETGGGSSPTVVDGTVYVSSSDLYAVAADTGEQEWAFEAVSSGDSSPTVVDGTVYVGSNDNNLYAVAADTGEQEWAFETGDDVESSPTVGDEIVYVGSDDDNLYAVAADTGEQEWEFETGAFVDSSPAVVDETAYVGSYDANLYAVAAGEADPALFTLTLTDVPASVVQDEAVTLVADVTNTGETADEQPITLAIDGESVAEETVALAPAESTSVDFEFVPGVDGGEAITIAVTSEDDTVTSTLEILEPALFTLTLTDVPASVVQNEAVTLVADVTNTGETADEQPITLAIGGDPVIEETVTLAPAESTSVAFDVEISLDGGQAVIIAASSEDDTVTSTLEILEPATFTVATEAVPETITPGETLTINVTIANEGEIDAEEQLRIFVDGSEVFEESVSVAGGTTAGQTIPEFYTVEESDGSEIEIRIAAGDAETVRTVAVTSDDDTDQTDDEAETADTDSTETDGDMDEADGNTDEVPDAITTTGDDIPGFGIGSAITALGAAGYVLNRRLSGSETDDE